MKSHKNAYLKILKKVNDFMKHIAVSVKGMNELMA